MVLHLSLLHGVLNGFMLIGSLALAAKRRRRVRQGVPVPPGGWVYIVIAAWMGLVLLFGLVLLLSGHAVVEYW
ncbi:MAG: hypothetical protein ABGW87_00085 [Sphingomonadaceae bacterium]